MDLAAGLAGLNAALDTLKGLRALEKAYDQAVLKAQIVDLMGHVSDAKMALLDAKEAIQARETEIDALKAKLKKQSETVEFDGYTYAANADGKPTGAPFCGACIAADGTQIRFNYLMAKIWQCPRCQANAAGLTKFP